MNWYRSQASLERILRDYYSGDLRYIYCRDLYMKERARVAMHILDFMNKYQIEIRTRQNKDFQAVVFYNGTFYEAAGFFRDVQAAVWDLITYINRRAAEEGFEPMTVPYLEKRP
jgi:hypothetical protein